MRLVILTLAEVKGELVAVGDIRETPRVPFGARPRFAAVWREADLPCRPAPLPASGSIIARN
ncbi:hypothetical protein Q4604_14285 [Marinovum sp. 1_MG-2023]|nr:hypothetical protein [Marinovum sp. 1_MG-2023]